jgi:hypothetical protein
VRCLVLKDLRVLQPWWWLIVPGYALFAANGIVSPELFFGMNAVLVWTYSMVLIMVDWKQDADRFVATLPVNREDVVKARYAGALGAAVLGTILYAVYGRVLLAFATERLLDRWSDTSGRESAVWTLVFFLIVWLVSTVYLPFYFRWGLARGTWLFVASLVAAVVGAALLLRGRPLSHEWAVWGGDPAVAAPVGLLVVVALGWLSLRLSVRFYDRRDL